MTAAGTIPPPVSWAQRNDLLYVIIDVECKDIEHKVTENTFYFKGTNVLDDKKYEVTINFLKTVDPERVSNKNIGRCMEFTIYKKEAGPYWPKLNAEKTKLHFLKANFTKWRNESDDEDEGPGGMGMGDGMPGGMGGMPFDMNQFGSDWSNKFDDFNVEDEDSDDNIPSLSQNDEDEGEADDKKETKEQ